MLLSVPLVMAVSPPQANGPPDQLPRGEAAICVTGQEKYYDTIAPYAADGLPWNGNNDGAFQQLFPGNQVKRLMDQATRL